MYYGRTAFSALRLTGNLESVGVELRTGKDRRSWTVDREWSERMLRKQKEKRKKNMSETMSYKWDAKMRSTLYNCKTNYTHNAVIIPNIL